MRQINNVKELCELNGNENFYQFGRSLYKYTACGPWCRLIMEDDSDIYYESDKANTKDINAVALEIGSIVEGSDVEIGPYRLDFPFDDETMWDVVEEINNEADFYWKRDNEDDFIIECGGKEYVVTTGWGFEYSEDTPESVKTFFENFYEDNYSDMEDGETRENSHYKVTKVDKSMFIY